MAKKVIRLTESELKRIIKESVEQTIDTIEEGAVWDAIKAQAETLDGTEDMFTRKNWDSLKDTLRGKPNQSEYEQARMLGKSARFDRDRATTPAERDLYDTRVGRYAKDELDYQPGLGGKLRRTGYAAGVYGAGLAKKLGRKLNRK